MIILRQVLQNDPETRNEIPERAERGSLSGAESMIGGSQRLRDVVYRTESAMETGFIGAEEAVIIV